MALAQSGPDAGASLTRGAAPALDPGVAARLAFLDALADVRVEAPVHHTFSGAIETRAADAIWTWIARDIAPSEAARLGDAIVSGAAPDAALERLLPDIVGALKANAEAERADIELFRRNTIQMGGEDVRAGLGHVVMAMRRRKLLTQAARFGAAVGVMADEADLAGALQSIAIGNPLTRALWMQAMVAHMSNPSRAMAAAVLLAGSRGEARVAQAGYGPLVEALLSHAQAQIGLLPGQGGAFADADLACKAVNRFHHLTRAIRYNLDIERKSPWGAALGDLVGRFSARLERSMREIGPNVVQALRRGREGGNVDPDQILVALGGLYLLVSIRQARDSLAVNALLDQVWTDTGQAVEVLVDRALDALRANPGEPGARERVDAGIKMAEIRFNAEYADILRRARDGAERRTAQS